MTILIHFHQSNYRNFYLHDTPTQWISRPGQLLLSLSLQLSCHWPALCLLCTGITFIDSTTLAVCKNPVSQDLCRTCQTRQNIYWMVLWIQTAFDSQWPRQIAWLRANPWQCSSLFLGLRADSSSETRDTYRGRYEINSFNVQLITGIRVHIMLPLLLGGQSFVGQILADWALAPLSTFWSICCTVYCRKLSLNLDA